MAGEGRVRFPVLVTPETWPRESTVQPFAASETFR